MLTARLTHTHTRACAGCHITPSLGGGNNRVDTRVEWLRSRLQLSWGFWKLSRCCSFETSPLSTHTRNKAQIARLLLVDSDSADENAQGNDLFQRFEPIHCCSGPFVMGLYCFLTVNMPSTQQNKWFMLPLFRGNTLRCSFAFWSTL